MKTYLVRLLACACVLATSATAQNLVIDPDANFDGVPEISTDFDTGDVKPSLAITICNNTSDVIEVEVYVDGKLETAVRILPGGKVTLQTQAAIVSGGVAPYDLSSTHAGLFCVRDMPQTFPDQLVAYAVGAVRPVPTVGETGLIVLAGALVAGAWWMTNRRTRAQAA